MWNMFLHLCQTQSRGQWETCAPKTEFQRRSISLRLCLRFLPCLCWGWDCSAQVWSGKVWNSAATSSCICPKQSNKSTLSFCHPSAFWKYGHVCIFPLERKMETNTAGYKTYLRLSAGDEWGLTQGVTLGVTEGVTEGVPLGVDCADVVSLSSLKSPLGILNFCRGATGKIWAIKSTRKSPSHA